MRYFNYSFVIQILLVIVVSVTSFIVINKFYVRGQEEFTLETATHVMDYARELLNEHGDLRVVGNDLYAGDFKINNTTEIVKHVKDITGFGSTIFSRNIRISTTATAKGSNKSALGTTANDEISQLVYSEGKRFSGITNTLGKDWIIIYEPLKDKRGNVIGMIAVFKEYINFKDLLYGFQITTGLVIFSFAASVIFMLWRSNKNQHNLREARNKLKNNNHKLSSQKKELEKLSIVAGEVEQAICIIGKDDRIEWINKSFTKSLGFASSDVIGRKVSEIVGGPMTDLSVVAKMDEAIFKKKEPIDVKVVQYRKDRSYYWARVFLSPILDDKGELEKYIGISLDISQEIKYEQQLQDSEANFRLIAESLNDTFYLYNVKENRYEFMSPNCETILGKPSDFFYNGGSFTQTSVASQDKELVLKAEELISQGKEYNIEYRTAKDDQWIWERAFPIYNEEGEIIRKSGIVSNITRRKQIEHQLESSVKNFKSLTELGLSLTQNLSTKDIVDNLHLQLKKILKIDNFGVGVMNPNKKALTFPTYIQNQISRDRVVQKLDTPGILQKCIAMEEIIVIQNSQDLYSDLPATEIELLDGNKPKSSICIPLKFKEDLLGVVLVQCYEENAYSQDQVNFLRSAASSISNTLANASLYQNMEQEIRRRTRQLEIQKDMLERSYSDTKLLGEVGLNISSSLQTEEIYERLNVYSQKFIEVDVFGIHTYDSKTDILEYSYHLVDGKQIPVETHIVSALTRLSSWSILNRKDIIINDREQEIQEYISNKEDQVVYGSDSYLISPMIVGNEVLGVIVAACNRKNAYSKRNLDLFKTLSVYAANAISNAKLYNSLEDKVAERTFELSLINEEIVSSINYTKRLQDATLPSILDREELFPKSFVFYRPKDIVSGDFYLVDKIRNNDGSIIRSFIVGDCTGHGVPGASLAILCSSILKLSFKIESVNSPGEALNYVREKLSGLFKSTTPGEIINDGMDVSFCCIDPKNNLYYAGANTYCIIHRNGEVIELKGDRNHVGRGDAESPFNTHTFQLLKGDRIILTSDGFTDQFNGETGKKYLKRKFINNVSTYTKEYNPNMDQLGKFVESEFENWRQGGEQTDDVCVMGIEI